MAVTRIQKSISSNVSILSEHWVSETEQEIQSLYTEIERNYPIQGYGTRIYGIKQDATSLLWHAEFSRLLSCD